MFVGLRAAPEHMTLFYARVPVRLRTHVDMDRSHDSALRQWCMAKAKASSIELVKNVRSRAVSLTIKLAWLSCFLFSVLFILCYCAFYLRSLAAFGHCLLFHYSMSPRSCQSVQDECVCSRAGIKIAYHWIIRDISWHSTLRKGLKYFIVFVVATFCTVTQLPAITRQ